ncbi:hypothetical protein O0L34_g15566 [Tuta absoluta]|nr:hypothetical protein O0L34_g15566 [Tuta absoluta]
MQMISKICLVFLSGGIIYSITAEIENGQEFLQDSDINMSDKRISRCYMRDGNATDVCETSKALSEELTKADCCCFFPGVFWSNDCCLCPEYGSDAYTYLCLKLHELPKNEKIAEIIIKYYHDKRGLLIRRDVVSSNMKGLYGCIKPEATTPVSTTPDNEITTQVKKVISTTTTSAPKTTVQPTTTPVSSVKVVAATTTTTTTNEIRVPDTREANPGKVKLQIATDKNKDGVFQQRCGPDLKCQDIMCCKGSICEQCAQPESTKESSDFTLYLSGACGFFALCFLVTLITLCVWKRRQHRIQQQEQPELVYSYVSVEKVSHYAARALVTGNRKLGERSFIPRVPSRPDQYSYDYTRPKQRPHFGEHDYANIRCNK